MSCIPTSDYIILRSCDKYKHTQKYNYAWLSAPLIYCIYKLCSQQIATKNNKTYDQKKQKPVSNNIILQLMVDEYKFTTGSNLYV